MLERTIECPICGEPYKFMAHYAGDQSACPSCVGKAEKKMRKWNPIRTWEELSDWVNKGQRRADEDTAEQD